MKFLKLILIALVFSLSAACLPFSLVNKNSGTILTIELKTDEPNFEEITDKTVKILQSRLNSTGTSADVSKTLPNRLEVKIYGKADLERLKPFLLTAGKLELMKVVSPPSPSPVQTYPSKEAALQSIGGKETANQKVLPFLDRDDGNPQDSQNKPMGKFVVVEYPAIVNGDDLRNAGASSLSSNNSQYLIHFSLKPAGAQKFGEWTAKNINNYLGVVLDSEVKSIAYIKSQITDSGQIDGHFTKSSAEDLALILKSGYLPATLHLVDEKTFGK
jgi:preprotein translocase subunit SecD